MNRWPMLFGRQKLAYECMPDKLNVVLDIGCGIAVLPVYLRDKVKLVFAIDSHEDFILLNSRNYAEVTFIVAIAESLPFRNQSFDAITMLDVLEHVGDEARTIEEIHRTLKEGGLLILSTPHQGLFSFLDYHNFKIYKLAARIVRGKEFYSSFLKSKHRHYSLNDIEELLQGKFKIIKVSRSGLLIEPLCNIILELERVFHIPVFSGLIRKIAEVDYHREYGSLSYNIMIKANKI